MKDSVREQPPVRLPNPTAESFVASLKVVHFFAIFFFWLVLVALLLHLAAFTAFRAGAFNSALELDSGQPVVLAPPVLDNGQPQPTTNSAVSASDEARAGKAWWGKSQARRVQSYVRLVLATMRLVGLLASGLLLVTLFVYLEIALLGRLAGVRYLTMSFFLMMFFVATVYSWEPLLPGTRIIGSLFVFDDFLSSLPRILHQDSGQPSLRELAFFYGRFALLPAVSFVLLVAAWLRFRSGYKESVLLNE